MASRNRASSKLMARERRAIRWLFKAGVEMRWLADAFKVSLAEVENVIRAWMREPDELI